LAEEDAAAAAEAAAERTSPHTSRLLFEINKFELTNLHIQAEYKQNPPQNQRQLSSPTHPTQVSHPHSHSLLRPGAYSHQRRDSDTLRNIPSSLSNLGSAGASSPTVVEHAYGGSGRRLSPPTKSLPSSSSSSSAGLSSSQSRTAVGGGSHRRSPTAPEVSTVNGILGMGGAGMKAARSWGIMDEDEFGESERERERGGGERGKSMERERGEKEVGRGGHGGRQGPPRPTSAPAPPLAAQQQQQQQQAGGLVPVPGRQFFVRSHPSILSYLHHQITHRVQTGK
jgi:serine/threonine-protein kinase TTK/MPS1